MLCSFLPAGATVKALAMFFSFAEREMIHCGNLHGELYLLFLGICEDKNFILPNSHLCVCMSYTPDAMTWMWFVPQMFSAESLVPSVAVLRGNRISKKWGLVGGD